MRNFTCNKTSLLLVTLFSVFLAACGGGGGGGGGSNTGGGSGQGASDDGDNNNGGDTGNDNGDSGNSSGDDGTGSDNGDTSSENPAPFETFQAASLVLGQPDFSTGDANQGGGGPDANTLNMPMGSVQYAADEDVFFIGDAGNSRVLGLEGIPDTANMNADFVLGQPDFTTSESHIAADSMFSPENMTVMQGRLAITDTDLNRVTLYDGIPTSGDALPQLVIGQESLDTFHGACDQSSLIHPHAHLLLDDGRVIVADAGNNRVLVWNETPTENNAPADMVLGQVDFGNCSYRFDYNFRHPAALWSDGTRLIVVDSEKHRVLIWNTFPTEGLQVPDVILGQSAIGHDVPNDDDQDGVPDGEWESTERADGVSQWVKNGDATARTLSYPRGVDVDAEGHLYVADMDNHRVLIWNEIPSESFAPADAVLGQPDFVSNETNGGEDAPNDKGFQRPVSVHVIGDQLFVTEWENSRILEFDAIAN